ncbi:tail fiber protein [Desulfovibrio desulfuricans]|uniref:tail fiber protein n=1 Tax=Desulfovibrio desulfuricans TaxID=876 RepID=UPI0039843CA6
MATFDVAKLLNKITQDIPGINTVLKALAKWDVSALTDVPDGAMQATTDANNNLTIKKKVSGSYTPVAKLMHDVDKLDGYHASASATANAVAVRNAQGALPGNILGNSATADTAVALAAGSVVPVNQGGTGATTASQARTNLGVAGSSDFTSHLAKQASPSVEGHVKLDAFAADGSNTAAPGGFGLGMPLAAQIPANTDLDTVVLPGFYSCKQSATATTLTNCPVAFAFSMLVEYGAYGPTQTITGYSNGAPRFQRTKSSSTAFSPWRSLPNGISDSTTTRSSTVAASATAVKAVNDATVHLDGTETISGDKTFTGMLSQRGTTPVIHQKHATLIAGAPPSADATYAGISAEDASGFNMGGISFLYKSSGVRRVQIGFPNSAGTGRIWPFAIEVAADDTSYATITTPPARDNSLKIATTAWVSANSLAVGDIVASLSATRVGGLLMNGAAVSRTTYAALFALIGTTFGAGDGSTTFNLPNAGGRVLQGANGNLMALLAAGLPNITGSFSIRGNQTNTPPGTTGAMYRSGTGLSAQNSSVEGGRESDNIVIDASRSSSIYGNSTTVQQSAIAVNYFIIY